MLRQSLAIRLIRLRYVQTPLCKSWTYVRYVMDRYVEKDVAAAPKEGALKGTKQERKMVFCCFIFTFTQVHPAFFFGRVTRLDYPFWLAHVCRHHQEGLNGSMSDQWSRKQATVANLSQPEGLVAAPEVKGEVQRFDEWSGAPCETKSHDVRCKRQHRTES